LESGDFFGVQRHGRKTRKKIEKMEKITKKELGRPRVQEGGIENPQIAEKKGVFVRIQGGTI